MTEEALPVARTRTRTRTRTRRMRTETEEEQVAEREEREREAMRAGELLAEMGLDTEYDAPANLSNDALASRMYVARHGMPITKPYVLKKVHRMYLRGATREAVAQHFNVSVITAARWKATILELIAMEVQNGDPFQMIGNVTSYYREIAETALREASMMVPMVETETRHPDGTVTVDRRLDKTAASYKVQMMRLAMNTKHAETLTLEKLGVFERARMLSNGGGDDETKKMSEMDKMIKAIMDPEIAPDDLTPDRYVGDDEITNTREFT